MRYQIDKLLALSNLNAGVFAAVREEEDEKDSGNDDNVEEKVLDESDPLSFKPDLQGMMSMFEDDDKVSSCLVIVCKSQTCLRYLVH